MSRLHQILWLSWKDFTHPASGGAEIVSREICRRLARAGHDVIYFTSYYPGAPREEKKLGYQIIRRGNCVTVYLHAVWYYFTRLRGWPSLVVDEINTVPFFASWYIQAPSLLFVHQLTREIWFYQMFFPVNYIGYYLEPIYLWLLRNHTVITVSRSTKIDLQKIGFKSSRIRIISEGIEIIPAAAINQPKYRRPTVLYLGGIRPMKRVNDVILAFNQARSTNPDLQLIIAGGGPAVYRKHILALVSQSPYSSDIKCLGPVNTARKKSY